MRCALLVSPSANRVYAQSAAALAMAELGVVSERVLGGTLGDLARQVLGSVEYVTFEAPELGAVELQWLSNLAATFALFQLDDRRLLPLDLQRWDQLDSDLISIQKYPGKTNEAFTKLLVNVTLNLVLVPFYGIVSVARFLRPLTYQRIEYDVKDFEAYCHFIQRWVKDKRLKHEATVGRVKGFAKLDLELGLDKARYKAGDTLRVNYVNTDTLQIAQVFQPRSFDLIVTDAPYGVQHGSRSSEGSSRSPLELLTDAIPLWRAALRPGGALGIAWNTLVARRAELEKLLTQSGLSVCDSPAYRGFEHQVDAAIRRDLIVARLTSP